MNGREVRKKNIVYLLRILARDVGASGGHRKDKAFTPAYEVREVASFRCLMFHPFSHHALRLGGSQPRENLTERIEG